mgnify:CR=1 FL=1
MRKANETGQDIFDEVRLKRENFIRENYLQPDIIELDQRSYDILTQYFEDETFDLMPITEETFQRLKERELLKIFDMEIKKLDTLDKIVLCKSNIKEK